jgi:hypothetical protein
VRRRNPQTLEQVSIVRSAHDLPSFFESLDMRAFNGVAVYYHRPSVQLAPDFYRDIIRECGRYASSKISDLLTRFQFEEKWVENILLNIPHLLEGIPVKQFFGRFKGLPGVIVSAGPSLRHSLPYLERMRDRALLCCVDTSWKVLQRCGIEPHLVMVLDAQKHSVRHFSGTRAGGAMLLADMVSAPVCSTRFRVRALSAPPRNITMILTAHSAGRPLPLLTGWSGG